MDQAMLGKIGNKVGDAKTPSKVDGNAAKNAEQSAQSTPAGETVELTSGARLLQRLDKTLAEVPEIDSSRVEAVKTAIASGEYQIDAQKIADAILRSDQTLN
jgi:negative regulator of flagellin synthesis FlgM